MDKVVDMCFTSNELVDGYLEAISEFEERYTALDISFTPKVHCVLDHVSTYHTHAIISRGLYIFYPLCISESLVLQTINVLNKEISSIFEPKIYSF